MSVPLPDSPELRERLDKFLQNSTWGVNTFAGHRNVLVNHLVEFIAQERSDLIQRLEQAMPKKRRGVDAAFAKGKIDLSELQECNAHNEVLDMVARVLTKAKENRL